MVHELYRKRLTLHYMNYSPEALKETLWVAGKLPPPDELTTDFLVDFLSNYSNTNTRNYFYYILKIICQEVGRPELMDPIPKPRTVSTVRRQDLLTQQEISSLLKACRDLYEHAIIEVLVESGCRISEVLSLMIQDIHHDKNFIYLNVDGKTGAREIPLLRSNLPSFECFLATHPNRDSGYVFYHRWHLDRPHLYRAMLYRITELFERAGVRKRDKTIHIFRHTKATYLLELGVPESIIKRFMGWSENSNMISNYTHLTSKSVKDFFSRLYKIEEEPLEPLYPEEERERIKQMFR